MSSWDGGFLLPWAERLLLAGEEMAGAPRSGIDGYGVWSVGALWGDAKP